MTLAKKIPSLSAQVLTPERTPAVNAQFVRLVEERIRKSPGLKGVALRTAVTTLNASRPDIVARAVARLLPDFIDVLEPLYADYHKSHPADAAAGRGFGDYLMSRRTDAVHALMGLADERSAGATHSVYQRFYNRLRNTIAREADAIMPPLSECLDAELVRGAEAA